MATPFLPKGSRTYRISPRVPERYKAVVGKGHVTRTLGTRDYAQAKRLVPAVLAKLYAEWDALLIGSTAVEPLDQTQHSPLILSADGLYHFDGIAHACAYFREGMRERHQAARVLVRDDAKSDPDKFWRGDILPVPAGNASDDLSGAVVAALRAMVRRTRDVLVSDLVLHDLAEVEGLAALYFKPPHCLDREFLLALARTYISFLDSIIADDAVIFDYVDEIQGRWEMVRNGGQFPLFKDELPAVAHQSVPLLSQFLDAYVRERDAGLSVERADVLRAVVRDLIQVCGDKPINCYVRADASSFKEVLLLLPSNLAKRKELRGLPLKEAAKKAGALSLRRQSAKNLKKKWSILSGLFQHAAVNYDNVDNPFVSRALAVSDGKSDAEKWDAFTPTELQSLLRSDLPGELHWLTWLAIYTGARANELCQLRGDLVRQHRDIHYIHIPRTLRLKSKASVRSIPIHPVLVEKGFLKFAEVAGSGLLFPNITEHKSGRKSDSTGKAFSRHLKAEGLKREKLSFHSLRHTFKAAWDRAHPASVEHRERLIGHVLKGVAGTYGQNFDAESEDMGLLQIRAGLLSKIQF